jgi:hypothetical protein
MASLRDNPLETSAQGAHPSALDRKALQAELCKALQGATLPVGPVAPVREAQARE